MSARPTAPAPAAGSAAASPVPDPGTRRRPTIAVLSTRDPRDPRSWSGTPFFAAGALERHLGELAYVGPMPLWPRKAMNVAARLGRTFLDRRILPGHTRALARFWGGVGRRRIEALAPPADLVFAPAGSVLIAELGTALPVVYSSDATVRLMLDYYPQFTGLSPRAVRVAEALEARAIARADLILYPTAWAARSAVEHYGADPAKLRVLPYGANLAEAPAAADPPEDEVCRLLMVGVSWTVKGADLAVETLAALRGMGIAAELTIVGCTPPAPVAAPGLELIPFLDKNRAADRQRLDAAYRRAGFFLLPTRSECYGIVLCEAAAYGLPLIASRTGGVPEIVEEAVTGHTLPLAARGAAYAEAIAAIWRDRPRYRAMRAASRRSFETRLNWDAWGAAAAAAMEPLLAARR